MQKSLIEAFLEDPKLYHEYRKFIECWNITTETNIPNKLKYIYPQAQKDVNKLYEVFKDKKYVSKLIIFGSARTDFFNTHSSDIDIAVRMLDSSYQSLVYEKVRNSVSRNFDIIFLSDLDEVKDYLLIEEINKGIDLLEEE